VIEKEAVPGDVGQAFGRRYAVKIDVLDTWWYDQSHKGQATDLLIHGPEHKNPLLLFTLGDDPIPDLTPSTVIVRPLDCKVSGRTICDPDECK
jgi:hypothetical protein